MHAKSLGASFRLCYAKVQQRGLDTRQWFSIASYEIWGEWVAKSATELYELPLQRGERAAFPPKTREASWPPIVSSERPHGISRSIHTLKLRTLHWLWPANARTRFPGGTTWRFRVRLRRPLSHHRLAGRGWDQHPIGLNNNGIMYVMYAQSKLYLSSIKPESID